MNTDDLSMSFQMLGIPKTHANVGVANMVACNKQYRSLFVNRRLPDHGWSDVQIQNILFLFSILDTNNKTLSKGGSLQEMDEPDSEGGETRWCGVGEREGRVYSSLVAQRHFGLSHGVGRSGDITEPQPKAAGSSALAKLTLFMVLDALRRGSGLHAKGTAANGIILPMCTGMSMSLLLSSLRTSDTQKNIVLWSRIDQKSCFKAITSAGFVCVPVQTKRDGDQVVTDLEAIKLALQEYGPRVLAIITTTSCFAPRVPDSVDEVAKLCSDADVAHVINNAYGLQCAQTSKLINRACTIGRVDAIVCSTDKNFLVPVGGAIVVSPHKSVIQKVGKVYAGRASSSPLVDLFITLLSMGLNGYKKLLNERMQMMAKFPIRLQEIASKHGERILQCPANTISYGMTLDNLARPKKDNESEQEYIQSIAREISSFGAMLFSRCISGTRVIPRGITSVMGGHEFIGFGSSSSDYPHAYMTAACAIGVNPHEIQAFFTRLDKALTEFSAKKRKEKKDASNEIAENE